MFKTIFIVPGQAPKLQRNPVSKKNHTYKKGFTRWFPGFQSNQSFTTIFCYHFLIPHCKLNSIYYEFLLLEFPKCTSNYDLVYRKWIDLYTQRTFWLNTTLNVSNVSSAEDCGGARCSDPALLVFIIPLESFNILLTLLQAAEQRRLL